MHDVDPTEGEWFKFNFVYGQIAQYGTLKLVMGGASPAELARRENIDLSRSASGYVGGTTWGGSRTPLISEVVTKGPAGLAQEANRAFIDLLDKAAYDEGRLQYAPGGYKNQVIENK